jgi:hypothetical protein
MGLVGKVIGPDKEGNVIADIGLEQDAAEHGPFGIDVRRPFPRIEKGIRCHAAASPVIATPPPPIGRPLSGRRLVRKLSSRRIPRRGIARCSHTTASMFVARGH